MMAWRDAQSTADHLVRAAVGAADTSVGIALAACAADEPAPAFIARLEARAESVGTHKAAVERIAASVAETCREYGVDDEALFAVVSSTLDAGSWRLANDTLDATLLDLRFPDAAWAFDCATGAMGACGDV